MAHSFNFECTTYCQFLHYHCTDCKAFTVNQQCLTLLFDLVVIMKAKSMEDVVFKMRRKSSGTTMSKTSKITGKGSSIFKNVTIFCHFLLPTYHIEHLYRIFLTYSLRK